jgi:outer membrane lipoprotein-sorting protein
VPAAVIVAIGGGALVPTLSGAAAPPQLPVVTAQQLVAQVIQAKVPPLSGTLTWTANLGLSDLSTLEAELGQGNGESGGGGDGFSPLSLLSGTYQINVWLGGPTSEHLALSESADQEVDLIRNGNQVWLWDSSTSAVTHIVAPAAAGTEPSPTVAPSLTPQQLADRFLNHLNHLSPTASVTVGNPLYVAGQPAYQLLVSPLGASGSTVNHIEIDVGASGSLQGVPLQVAIYANGQASAALELGFTGQVNLGQPAASELTFTPPPGATVTTHDLTRGSGADHGSLGHLSLTPTGSGWATVLTGNAPDFSATTSADLDAVTSVVDVGGQQARLFNTDLFNALIMPDGHFYAGLVTPAVLEAAASSSS